MIDRHFCDNSGSDCRRLRDCSARASRLISSIAETCVVWLWPHNTAFSDFPEKLQIGKKRRKMAPRWLRGCIARKEKRCFRYWRRLGVDFRRLDMLPNAAGSSFNRPGTLMGTLRMLLGRSRDAPEASWRRSASSLGAPWALRAAPGRSREQLWLDFRSPETPRKRFCIDLWHRFAGPFSSIVAWLLSVICRDWLVSWLDSSSHNNTTRKKDQSIDATSVAHTPTFCCPLLPMPRI